MKLRMTIDGINLTGCQALHQGFLYHISDKIMKSYSVSKVVDGTHEAQSKWRISGCGFYVCDLTRLFEGKIDRYKLM